jgi:hypothetical protein
LISASLRPFTTSILTSGILFPPQDISPVVALYCQATGPIVEQGGSRQIAEGRLLTSH